MGNAWAVDNVPTPRDALARYSGAWSADSSKQTALNELVASLRLAVDELDAKDEQNAFLLASAEAAQAQLAECRAELATARAFVSSVVDAPGDYPAEVSA